MLEMVNCAITGSCLCIQWKKRSQPRYLRYAVLKHKYVVAKAIVVDIISEACPEENQFGHQIEVADQPKDTADWFKDSAKVW